MKVGQILILLHVRSLLSKLLNYPQYIQESYFRSIKICQLGVWEGVVDM